MKVLGQISIYSVEGCAEGWLSDWTVTHRSSSSLGNFLLMTASSLLANIWKGAEDRQSHGFIIGRMPSNAHLTHESNTKLLQSHQQMISCHGVLRVFSTRQDFVLWTNELHFSLGYFSLFFTLKNSLESFPCKIYDNFAPDNVLMHGLKKAWKYNDMI